MSTIAMTAPSASIDRDDLRDFAKTRDPQAFERLTRRYIDVVYTFCRRQISDPELAEDVTQAVFVLLAQKADSIPRNVILSGWLFDAARYCCMNARRSESRRTFHETEAAKLRGLTMNPSQTSSALEDQDAGAALHQAMTSMKSCDREVLLLRFFERQSHNEIATALGVTEEAAKQRIKRALGKLRSILARSETASSASLAAFPTWMDSHALMRAPESLIQAAAQGGAATASTPNVPFHASAKFAGGLGLKIALGSIITTAIAAVVVSQIQSNGRPIPAAPATLPAGAPAAQVNLTSPVEALRTMSTSIKALDIGSVRKSLIIPDDEEGQLVLAGLEMEVANLRTQQAARKAFGPQAVISGATDQTVDDVVDRTLAQIGPADVQINGDHAIIGVRCGDDLLTRMPVMRVWEGAPLYFVHDADGWKFEPVKSMGAVLLDPQGRPQPIDRAIRLGQFRAITVACNEITAQIESKQIPDVRTATTHLAAAIQRELRENKITLPIGYIAPVPRGFLETLGIK